jgi:hypothetical protein
MRVLGLVLLASVMMVSGCHNSTVEQIRVPAAPRAFGGDSVYGRRAPAQ